MSDNCVELVTIGTELLLGFTVDTNGAFLGQALSAAGMRIVRRTSVGDRPDEIRAAVDEALSRTGFVITTGGLGPTRDDMSKHVVADLLGMPLEFDDKVWEAVLARYRRFGRVPVESNRSQAMVPRGGMALPNQWGTAPGLWLESPRGLVVMLPGVPLEMRMLMEHEVLPRLAARGGGTTIASAVLRTCGIPESTLAERIGELEDALAPLTLAYLPSVVGVDLRLTAWNEPADQAREMLARRHRAPARRSSSVGVRRRREPIWPRSCSHSFATAVATLAIAESCTGGMLGGAHHRYRRARRTSSSVASSRTTIGSSATCSACPTEMIAEHGAVSAEVAHAMAEGAASSLGADIAVSVTGIAGPGGGSDEKPVGTVWFGFSVDGQTDTHKSVFGGTRTEIRERAVQGALWGLWQRLGGGGER